MDKKIIYREFIYIANNFFIKNLKNLKFSCNSFSNILSIDELNTESDVRRL